MAIDDSLIVERNRSVVLDFSLILSFFSLSSLR